MRVPRGLIRFLIALAIELGVGVCGCPWEFRLGLHSPSSRGRDRASFSRKGGECSDGLRASRIGEDRRNRSRLVPALCFLTPQGLFADPCREGSGSEGREGGEFLYAVCLGSLPGRPKEDMPVVAKRLPLPLGGY